MSILLCFFDLCQGKFQQAIDDYIEGLKLDEKRKSAQKEQDKLRNKQFFTKVQELNAFQLESLANNGKGI